MNRETLIDWKRVNKKHMLKCKKGHLQVLDLSSFVWYLHEVSKLAATGPGPPLPVIPMWS